MENRKRDIWSIFSDFSGKVPRQNATGAQSPELVKGSCQHTNLVPFSAIPAY